MYKNPHYKPEMVVRPAQVYNGNPYANKTVSSSWGPEVHQYGRII